ncbi:MAG TPA: heme exporter protein CcmB [Actinomycetota bacterium]|nr:heme exporter protein CcmB [Actinomycetota bacterium]
MIRDAIVVARKDLRLELRGHRAVNALVPFVGAALLLFGFAFGPGRAQLQAVAPGLLWLATLFAGVLALRASFDAELEDGALDELVLAAVDPAGIYLGKVGALVLELLALQILTMLAAAALFGLGTPGSIPALLAISTAGVVGFGAVGATFAALASRARAREALLPVLLLPLATPVLIGAVRATQEVLASELDAAWTWVGLLVAFASLAVAGGVLSARWVLEAP